MPVLRPMARCTAPLRRNRQSRGTEALCVSWDLGPCHSCAQSRAEGRGTNLWAEAP